jgi:hypothetical protein
MGGRRTHPTAVIAGERHGVRVLAEQRLGVAPQHAVAPRRRPLLLLRPPVVLVCLGVIPVCARVGVRKRACAASGVEEHVIHDLHISKMTTQTVRRYKEQER